MCLIQDVINRKNRRAQTETQLSKHGIKSTNSYLQRLTWSSHSVAHSQFFLVMEADRFQLIISSLQHALIWLSPTTMSQQSSK